MRKLKQIIGQFEKFEQIGFLIQEQDTRVQRLGSSYGERQRYLVAKRTIGSRFILEYRYELSTNSSEFLIFCHQDGKLESISDIFQFIPFYLNSRSHRIQTIDPNLLLKALLNFLKRLEENEEIKDFRGHFIEFYRQSFEVSPKEAEYLLT